MRQGEKKIIPKNEINQVLAEKYASLLNSIDLSDEILYKGLQEGLNKFLSNAYLHLLEGKNKYCKAHYISMLAMEKIGNKNFNNLVFEHMVPKSTYIQKPCEEKAKKQKIHASYIEAVLNKYWFIAAITKEEDAKLSRRSMPKEWDNCDILARYREAGIELVRNPYYALSSKERSKVAGNLKYENTGLPMVW